MKFGKYMAFLGAAVLFLGGTPVFSSDTAEHSRIVVAKEHGGKEHGGKEHGGKEHGGKEHGGTTQASAPIQTIVPSPSMLRDAIRDHVAELESEEGGFQLVDEVTGTTRELDLIRVHQRVGKTGNLYYSCVDVKDQATGEILDVDFNVESTTGGLEVVETIIHKVDGDARYTYDSNDNRVEL